MTARSGGTGGIGTSFVEDAFATEASADRAEALSTAVSDLVERVGVTSSDELHHLLQWSCDHATGTTDDEVPGLGDRTVVERLLEAVGHDVDDDASDHAEFVVSLENDSLPVVVTPPGGSDSHDAHLRIRRVLEGHDGSDAGVVTDGVEWSLWAYDRVTYTVDVLAEVDVQPVFEVAMNPPAGGESLGTADETAAVNEFLQVFGATNLQSIVRGAPLAVDEAKRAVAEEFYGTYAGLVLGDDDAPPLLEEGILPPENATGNDVRLFALRLVNRLLAVKCLEGQGVVNRTLLSELAAGYESSMVPSGFYETYLEPLCFDGLGRPPDRRPRRLRETDPHGDLPYLDVDLFRPTADFEGEGVEERDFDVEDGPLLAAVDRLDEYEIAAVGSPRDLGPGVLTEVFERVANRVTTAATVQEREPGDYRLPAELPAYCVRETVRPAIARRFEAVLGDRSPNRGERPDLVELLGAVPDDGDAITELLSELDDFRAVDPACGSGRFLRSVLEEVTAVRTTLRRKRGEDPDPLEVRGNTVRRNCYGVDEHPTAVEMAKHTLWLSALSTARPGDPDRETPLVWGDLSTNFEHGNSLVGVAGDEGPGTIPDADVPDVTELARAVEARREATDPERRAEHRRRIEALRSDYRAEFDRAILAAFRDAGLDDVRPEQVREWSLHWPLVFPSAMANGGFDAVVTDPPWEPPRPRPEDVLSRHDTDFHVLSREDRSRRAADLLTNEGIAGEWDRYREEVDARIEFYRNSAVYRLQSADIGGRTVASTSHRPELFAERSFALSRDGGHVSTVLPGRVFNGTATKPLRAHLVDETGLRSVVGFESGTLGALESILGRPGLGIVVGETGGRTGMLEVAFQQSDPAILRPGTAGLATVPRRLLAEYSPNVRLFPLVESETEAEVLLELIDHPPIADRDAGGWYVQPYFELTDWDDEGLLVGARSGDYPIYTSDNLGQFAHEPVGGAEVDPPSLYGRYGTDPDRSAKHRIRMAELERLAEAIADRFDGAGDPEAFADELLEDERGKPLTPNDVLLDVEEYRIAFRDLARSTDERTVVAAVLPPGPVCSDELHATRALRIDLEDADLSEDPLGVYRRTFTDRELFAALALINSIPFDYLLRRKTMTDTTIAPYKFEGNQVPRLTADDDWFKYLWRRSARLNCYGEAFAPLRNRLGIDPATDPADRERLRVQIDAAVFHAYGLDREEVSHILSDFQRVRSAKLMTEEYFRRVLQMYDAIAAVQKERE